MTKLTIDEKYAKELDKAEVDHHKPTAGAMLGHVLSNLFIENVRLTQAGTDQNALKYIIQRRITEIAGDPYDRIADLSRIILFLLSKVNLTTEEHTLLDPLLQHAQTAQNLADIFNREHHIQDYVQHVKSDPKGYLNE